MGREKLKKSQNSQETNMSLLGDVGVVEVFCGLSLSAGRPDGGVVPVASLSFAHGGKW